MSCINEFGQPIGEIVPNWKPSLLPEPIVLTGRTCRLEPLDIIKHGNDLYTAYSHDDERFWTYMFVGPFANAEEYLKYAEQLEKSIDTRQYAVIDLRSGKAVGTIALDNIAAEHGKIEVGYITFSRLMQQTILSTEAQYLLMAYVFEDLGYRRYEWKCHHLNAPSRNAAIRLGFRFEACFQKHMVVKGRHRDTDWFAISSDQWPAQKAAFQGWLAPENFDDQGRQIRKLEDFYRPKPKD